MLRYTSPFWKIYAGSRNKTIVKSTGPEPGTYNLPTTLGKGPKIVLHGRRPKEHIEAIPGPGAYNPNPKIIIEKYPKIALSTAPRCEKDYSTKKDVPGPGMYKLKSTLDGPKFGFGIGKKLNYSYDQGIPGPGAYKVPCTIGKAENYQLPGKKTEFGYI